MTIAGAIILAVWVLALGQTIVNLVVVPRLNVRRSSRRLRVSIIIPARNEERAIEETIRGFLDQTYPDLEVIVVDDRSTDATRSILARIEREDSRLRVIDGEEPPSGWLGKPWALHQGSSRSAGDMLLFVDADVHYRTDAVEAAVAALEDSPAAMLTLFPRFEMRGFWEHIAMPQIAWLGFVLIPLWITNHTRSRHAAVGGGTGNLVRRDAYLRAGGHESLRHAVVDDVALARQLRGAGHRTLFVLADELTSLRMYHGFREIVRGFTKNVFMVIGRNYVAAALMLIILMLGNFAPYVLTIIASIHALQGVPLTDVEWFAIAAVVVITIVRLTLWIALRYRLDNALLGHPVLTLFWIYILLHSIWYTGIRGRIDWRGRTYDAASTRFGAHE